MVFHPGDDGDFFPFGKVGGKAGNAVCNVQNPGHAHAHAADVLDGQPRFGEKIRDIFINPGKHVFRAKGHLGGRPFFPDFAERTVEDSRLDIGPPQVAADIIISHIRLLLSKYPYYNTGKEKVEGRCDLC